MLLLAILAAASAWLVTRKAPRHQPLAWALTLCAGLDAVRLLGLPAHVDMALCLSVSGVSAIMGLVVFSHCRVKEAALPIAGYWVPWLLAALAAPRAREWWPIAVPFLYGVSCLMQGLSALISKYTTPWTISQRVALILLAGDALAVASLCAREWISSQAGLVLAAVTVYQMIWWWRWNRWERN